MAPKSVLITGGNRGLGRALVEKFSTEGWNVIATARKAESLPETCSLGISLDLSESEQIGAAVEAMKGKTIDLIIHNAGYNPKDNKEPGYFESTFRVKDFRASNVMESCMINALHPMELTGKLLPQMSSDAAVIGISSWFGSIAARDTESKGVAGHYAYTGSKALMNMCLKSMSLEFAKDQDANRSSIALNPGWMKTDMGGRNADRTPEQVAEAIYEMAMEDDFLLSQNGKFLNIDRSEHAW